MANKEGYKKTEVGWIPEDWDLVKIGALTKPVSKKNTNGEIKKVVSVTKYDGIVDSLEYFNKQVYSQDLTTYKIISRNQFAYATIHLDEGSIGYLSCCDKAVLSPMYTVFSIDNSKVDKDFLFGVLKSNRLMNLYNHIGAGSINRRKSISYNTFSRIGIPLPPFPEQMKIADILTTVDDKISSIDSQIQQTEQLKKGLMEKLLTEGIGHTEFKETEIGRVPVGWDVVKLADCCERIQDGTHFSPKSKKGPFMYLTSKNIKFGRIDLTNVSYLSMDEHESIYSRCPVKTGDVLLTKDGANTGNVALNDLSEPFSLLSSVAFIRPLLSKATNAYIFQYLLSPNGQKMVKNAMAGQAITRITLTKIKAFQISLPPLQEQKQIATILSTVDDKLGILTQKKSHYQTLKKGLSQQLLTGQMRLKV